MLKALSLSLLFLCASFVVKSQEKWIDTKASPIESIDLIKLPLLDNEKLRDKYGFHEVNNERTPHTFAEAVTTDISTTTKGTWESSVNGYLIWRQRITSKNAYSLNLGFTNFFLPPSASLFLTDGNRNNVIGPITQKDNDDHQEWWSPIVPGEEIILEIQVDPKEVNQLKLHLSKVNHDFAGFGAVLSASCNLDVICGEEDGFGIVDKYRDILSSVGQMLIQGRFQCTGSLVNNTKQDCTPYIITAEHCGISEETAASVVVYWNFQNSQCRQPDSVESGANGDGSRNQFNSGSKLIAKYDQTDFTLVELDDPVDPISNPYFNGWDRGTEDVDSAVVIHHPSGDEKRISFDFDSLVFNVDRNFVQVRDWDIGTTEQGSSGSPLFSKSGLVVGYLSGGDAACGNDLEDDFGMFKTSWEGGGTPETRLKDWLDPVSTEATSINGRYCSDVAILNVTQLSICAIEERVDTVLLRAIEGFGDPGVLSIEEATNGLQVSFSTTSLGQNQSAEIYIQVTNDFIGSFGEIKIRVENDLGPNVYSLPITVFRAIPSDPVIVAPQSGVSGLNFDITFEWMGTAPLYTLEISELISFGGAIRTIDNIASNSITLKDFQSSTMYYWRIKALNACGVSSYSSISSFSTGQITCQTFNAADLPQTIGLDLNTVSSVISVASGGTLADVNVRDITGTHTWIRDLTFKLTSPSGTVVILAETPCDDEDNFRVSFDDDSDNINLDCPLTTGRAFKPVEPLSALIGEQAAGDWVLSIEDGVGEDGGAFSSWTLELCINAEEVKRVDISPPIIELCDNDLEQVDLNLTLRGGWSNPDLPMVSTGSGIAIGVVVSPSPIASSESVSIFIGDPSLLIGQDKLTISFVDGQETIISEIPIIHKSSVETPILSNPTDQSIAVSLQPTLRWVSGLNGMGSHRVVISKDPSLMDIVVDEITPQDSFVISTDFDELTEFFWQVTAIGLCSDSTSSVHSFTTDRKVATIDEELFGIKLYPSPASEYLTIDLGDLQGTDGLYVKILSISGQEVSRTIIGKEIVVIPVHDLRSGLYLVSFVSQKGILTRKIVVDR